ncbi:hypothetical protein FBU30_005119 [Linnemannia zychae]|nr:hypothetical protein FBU30_005119 [Linnemannia zychae]
MSLYGDLPPPSSSKEDDTPVKKSTPEDGAGTSSASPAKSTLPAGWSSVTRFKPINRKPAPPKQKPTMRSIPAGFSQSTTTIVTATSTTNEPQNGVTTVYSAPTTVVSSTVTSITQASKDQAKTVDENSWLRARTAQVQRQDSDAQGWRQPKRAPAKAQQVGPMSLEDEYDIARPNEYEEFKVLFEEDRRLREEDRRLREEDQLQGVTIQDIMEAEAEAEVGIDEEVEAGARVVDEWDDHALGQDRVLHMVAFAPPPSQVNVQPIRHVERDLNATSASPMAPAPSVQNTPAYITNDASGEDAFNRRAMLSQQRAQATQQQLPPSQYQAQRPQQQRPGFVPASQPSPFKGTPSAVILLTNMVGPGEVDNTLQEETAAECEKFGAVVRCLIFEVQKGKVPPEEAVRIFVKFETKDAAERALRDLHGRFFGGRQVRGQFYDEARFDALQLAP